MSSLKWIGSGLFGLLFLLCIWGVGIEPRFLLDVKSYEAQVPNLPPEWEGHSVALLADLQVGMWLGNPGMVEESVEATLAADPALVLIAGDFVYEPDSARVQQAVGLLRPLTKAGVPVVAVFGNHDYSLSSDSGELKVGLARYLRSELEAIGVRVLENESIPIRVSETKAPIYAVGLGSVWAGRSRPKATLSGVPAGAARVVFMHNPIAYRQLPEHSGPLTLAGHTHGGLIRLPFTPSESWLHIARAREVVADGWATDSIGAPGNRLYVTRGVGLSILPLRIFCRPELTLFTLRSPPKGSRDPS